MSWRHPSDAALDRWSTGASDRRTERHARRCPMCLERLEQLTDLEPRLRAELETDRMPRPDMEDVLWKRVEARLAEREAVSVLTEMMDVGPETSRVLLEGPGDEGGDNE